MKVLDIPMIVVLGLALSWYWFYFRKKDLLGGFTGGTIVGLLGAVLGGFLLNTPVQAVLGALQSGLGISNVNIVGSLIGGYAALYIFNRINHDRNRKDF